MRNFREVKTVEAADELLAYLRRQFESDPSEMAEQEIKNLQARRRLLSAKHGEPEPQHEPEPPPRVEKTRPAPPAPKPKPAKAQPTEKAKPSTALFWERQPDETHRAHQAFLTYLNLGVTRSLRRATVELYGLAVRPEDLPGTSPKLRQMKTWSAENLWVARAEAFDAEMERRRRLEREEAIVEALDRHRRVAQMIQSVGLEGLQMYRGGGPHEPLPTLLRYIESGLKEERLALGIPTDISQLEHRGEVATNVEDIEGRRQLDSIRRATEGIRRRL